MDTSNDFLVSVGVAGGEIMFMAPIPRVIDKEKALRLAAYIVCLADPGGVEFAKVLEAIQNT